MIQSKLLRRFLSIERQLFKARDSRELLNRIVKEAVSLLDVDCASIYRYNEKERTLTWEATFGIDEKFMKFPQIADTYDGLLIIVSSAACAWDDLKKAGMAKNDDPRLFRIRR